MTVESAAAAAASESNYYQLLVRIYTGRKFPAPEDGAKAVALECRCIFRPYFLRSAVSSSSSSSSSS